MVPTERGEEELVITEFRDDDYDDDGFVNFSLPNAVLTSDIIPKHRIIVRNKPKKSKLRNFMKKTFGTAKCPFLQNNKVETLIPSKVNVAARLQPVPSCKQVLFQPTSGQGIKIPELSEKKNAEKPRLKDSGEPGPKEAGKPGPKEAGKPGPKDTRKPGQKDDKKPRQKDGKRGLKVDVNPASFDDIPADAEPESGPKITSVRESLASKYDFSLSDVLGEGSFGRVYKGTRRSDGKEVAIKLMERNKDEKYLVIPGYTEPLPTEVGLTLKMRECHSPFVIEMYDWYEDPNMIALVSEYPQPSQTLWEFLTSRHTPLTESTARPLMYQAVQAVQHCLDHGVFHADVHLGNFFWTE
ncbi:uncharacterized protein [Misgurnus anguillicaudatus]|uniref:uncharacterized protein n=1 Tax=Misgurnus anguillicaudatus TaxID=75329 RepID=UPI003CCF79B2